MPITFIKANPPMANIPMAIPIEPIISKGLRPYFTNILFPGMKFTIFAG